MTEYKKMLIMKALRLQNQEALNMGLLGIGIPSILKNYSRRSCMNKGYYKKANRELSVIEYNKFQKNQLNKNSNAQRSQIIKNKMRSLEKRMNAMKLDQVGNSKK